MVARTHRIAAVALLFACVLAVSAGLLLPLASAFIERRDLVAEAKQRLAAAYARRKNIPALEARREDLELAMSKESGLIVAASEADAAQQFQQVCRKLMAVHGVELNGLRNLSASREGEVVAVRLEASMRMSVERLAFFIAAMEFGEPNVFFERVRLARNTGKRVAADTVDMSAIFVSYAALDQQEKTRP
jgi:hypothetical protein